MGVHARDLAVPAQRERVRRAAPDRQAVAGVAEMQDLLRAVTVAIQQERQAATLGLKALFELCGGGPMRRVRMLHRVPLYSGVMTRKYWTLRGAAGLVCEREAHEIGHLAEDPARELGPPWGLLVQA